MSELPKDQKTPLGPHPRERKRAMERIVHNPVLVSLRHVNGKRRHIHCISVDVLEDRIGVTFRGPKQRERYFTEWFDRKFWHLITGDEKKAYYHKKEEYRSLVENEEYKARVAEREKREARRARRLGAVTPEQKDQLEKKRHERRVQIAVEVNSRPKITFEELPAPTLEESPAPPPEPTDPDALTPAEEEALAGPKRPFPGQVVGNLERELPGEYNAMLHMKEKYPFGDPAKLRIFDALVTAEAVKDEALRKLKQRTVSRDARAAIEKGMSVWSTGSGD